MAKLMESIKEKGRSRRNDTKSHDRRFRAAGLDQDGVALVLVLVLVLLWLWLCSALPFQASGAEKAIAELWCLAWPSACCCRGWAA